MESTPSVEEASYVRTLRFPIAVTSILFTISVAVGYFAVVAMGMSIMEALRETFLPTFGGLNPWQLFLIIFANNSAKTFAVVILGVTFGIAPAFFLAANGFVLGMIATETANAEGIAFVLAALLPHGVLELPAVILGASVGVRVGVESLRKIRGRGAVRLELRRGMMFFLKRLLPLLLAAAVVETFITPWVVSLVRLP